MSDPKTPPKPPATPPDQPPGQPQPKKPIGDPPNTKPPAVAIGKPQVTLEPGENGRSTGPTHTEPLVKNSPQRERVGPGTYGNDQFAAEHHDDFVDDGELPEGLCDPQGGPLRPTAKPKEDHYGRIGDKDKG
ncbi:MAG: hypothetical protein ACK4Z4_14955, partial [Ferrovibrio sp.]